MTSKQPKPTAGELEILRVLWECGPRSVREIQRELDKIKRTGYTTVLKLLQIMTDKGLVTRDENQRPQMYDYRQRREYTQRERLQGREQRAFGGAAESLEKKALGGGE